MVTAAFAIPYRPSDPRREELFLYTTAWLRKHHPTWPIHLGESPSGPFNRGAAINDAVSKTDADVLIVHDADNIADPETLKNAVELAHITGRVTYPFETYTYLDEHSSNRLITGDSWFIAPELHPAHVYRTTVRHQHYSGIQVIPRRAYEAVGGFISLTGWGAEDAIMDTLFRVYVNDSEWQHGGAYHLWHPAKRNDPKDPNNVRNHNIWRIIKGFTNRPQQLREYLESIGHVVPMGSN